MALVSLQGPLYFSMHPPFPELGRQAIALGKITRVIEELHVRPSTELALSVATYTKFVLCNQEQHWNDVPSIICTH